MGRRVRARLDGDAGGARCQQNQIQVLEAYAAAHGLRFRVYRDEGVSAKDTDRLELQRLLGDVRSGLVRTVLVTKLDRISRSIELHVPAVPLLVGSVLSAPRFPRTFKLLSGSARWMPIMGRYGSSRRADNPLDHMLMEE